MKQPASIFNDVIGPVMIGPSSSHTAASVRIGSIGRQMIDGEIKRIIFSFNSKGALATTYHGQGSDIGLVGGFLNYKTKDEGLVDSLKEAEKIGIEIDFNIMDYGQEHPNTYRITVINEKDDKINYKAISIGGGMIEITEIQGIEVSIAGDFFETVILLSDRVKDSIEEYLAAIKIICTEYDYTSAHKSNNGAIINIKTNKSLEKACIEKIKAVDGVCRILELEPVLPVKSRKNCRVPFTTAQELLTIAETKGLEMWEAAALYESIRGNISEAEVFYKMKEIVLIMIDAISMGKAGTSYKDRILGPQAYLIEKGCLEGKLIPGEVFNAIITDITSIMEVKSSMGVIVAAPTAGSCGALPGTIIATGFSMNYNIDHITKAMLASGIIGIFIAEHATFSAEVCGCQAECGAGSGMAAAGLVQLLGGTVQQGIDAASMALQNILGMVCDPVADRVEVPCLGKNVMAGVNALSCANMILAGFDKVIPLDETIDALYKVGNMLPYELRCTGYGGLSVTNTAKKIHKSMC